MAKAEVTDSFLKRLRVSTEIDEEDERAINGLPIIVKQMASGDRRIFSERGRKAHDVARLHRSGDELLPISRRRFRSGLLRETDLLAYALNEVTAGSSIPVVVLRDGEKVTLTLNPGG